MPSGTPQIVRNQKLWEVFRRLVMKLSASHLLGRVLGWLLADAVSSGLALDLALRGQRATNQLRVISDPNW